jgi:hypothetical protein
MAASLGGDYNDESLDIKQRLQAAEDSKTWAGVMWLGFGAGAALMTTGLILWLTDDGSPGTSASVSPTADGQGMVFSIGGSW